LLPIHPPFWGKKDVFMIGNSKDYITVALSLSLNSFLIMM